MIQYSLQVGYISVTLLDTKVQKSLSTGFVFSENEFSPDDKMYWCSNKKIKIL